MEMQSDKKYGKKLRLMVPKLRVQGYINPPDTPIEAKKNSMLLFEIKLRCMDH